jgi:zinc protease
LGLPDTLSGLVSAYNENVIAKYLLLALTTAAAFAASGPGKVFPYAYTQEDLSNGLRLVVAPTDFPNIVATYIVVRAGSRNEVEPGHTGFAHFFEHVMFKGTKLYPKEKYNETLRQIGAASNAFTTDDYTCYYTVFSKEDLPTVIAMEADRFQNLRYSEPEFRTEALAVLGEYNKNSSSPFSKMNEVLRDTAFDRHTYKHTTMGFLKDIQDMPNQYEYSQKFFDRFYRPEYTTIVVVGDVKTKAVREMVDKAWGSWKKGSYKADIPVEPPQEKPRTANIDWQGPALPTVTVAFRSPAYTDDAKDLAALDALAYLAFSPTSDLYQQLVIKEQKVDGLSGGTPNRVDPYLYSITARVKKQSDVEYVRDRILETVKTFQKKPVDAARLDAVRKRLRYQLALSLDSSDAIAGVLASYIALRGSPETLNKLYDQYAAVTPEDLQKAAAKYLIENNRTIVTLTPAAPRGGSQ